MSEFILETQSLTKAYHGVNAIDNVSIKLKRGKIYGLIGQNGVGKTTFMRLIAGLIYPISGDICLFGSKQPKDIQKARQRVGFMIETPSINSSMTAKENIALHRIIRGIPNREIEDNLLYLVGLQDVKNKKARNFSLGMKQRLGIALALVGSPELLVLDEPINGLDPVGMVDVRQLLQKLCTERNMTILLSSHNLPELYQTATDYIILDHGVVKKIITLQELEEQCKQYLLIKADKPELAVSLIEQELHTKSYLVMPDKSLRLFDFTSRVDEVAAIFKHSDILITNLSVEGNTLENYYMSIVGGNNHV